LKGVLSELDTGAIDMDLTGFADAELEQLMTQFHPEDEDEQPRLDERNPITCPFCKREFTPNN